MLPWLKVKKVEIPCNALTIQEAARLFERSVGALHRDCVYLDIDTSRRTASGGCLTRDDIWIIYAHLCWRVWTQFTNPYWRGDRKDYSRDCPTDEDKSRYVEYVGGSKKDCFSRFDEAIRQKREKRLANIPKVMS